MGVERRVPRQNVRIQGGTHVQLSSTLRNPQWLEALLHVFGGESLGSARAAIALGAERGQISRALASSPGPELRSRGFAEPEA